MSILGAGLAAGRRRAESRMTETVRAGVFADATDAETGDPTFTLVTERYLGDARVKYPSSTVSESSGPGQDVASQDILVSVPVGSPRLFEGDYVEVVSSSVDESLEGCLFRVTGSPAGGQVTAHRYPVVELS